jgi:hypothetical protein
MDNPRIVRGREGVQRATQHFTTKMHKHGGDLSPLPRVAFLSPPQRGQELARILGIRTKEEMKEDEELEERHSPTTLHHVRGPLKSRGFTVAQPGARLASRPRI